LLFLCTMAAFALLILPGREFGQREHLLVIAILPYLSLCARQIEGSLSPPARIRLLLGIVAGVGIALKPYFLAAPAMTELAVFLFGARRPQLLRAENAGLAAVCLIYAAWIAVFEQTYVYKAASCASEIYGSFNRPIQQILPRLEMQVIVVAPFAAIALLKR